MNQIFATLALLILVITTDANEQFFSSKKQPDIDFSSLQKDTYYFGRVSDNSYFVKFDSICEKYLSGVYFEYTNEPFANKIKFEVSPRRRSYDFKSSENEEEVRIDIQIRPNFFRGQFKINNRFLGIFNRYSDPTDFIFRIHEIPEFKTYPQRYKENIFSDVQIKDDVIYGSARGYWDSYLVEGESYWRILERGIRNSIIKRDLILRMDIYTPENDTLQYRPLLMLIHGGGFYIGDKQSRAFREWSKYFASLGYTVASINYRIGFKPINYSVERAGYRAIQDAHAAMRFLVKNKDIYKIDTTLLFVGGSSAGAITSLNLAFMRNKDRPKSSFGNILLDDLGNIEESTNPYTNNFSIKAVINMWGALDDINILANHNASILSFHGTDDKIVPYGYDYPFRDIRGRISTIVFNRIYGSLPIHHKARELNIREKLYTIENIGHSPHVDENDFSIFTKYFYKIKNEMQRFLYHEIIPEEHYITTIRPSLTNSAHIAYRTQNTDFTNIHWKIEGGLIVSAVNNSVRVVWFDDADYNALYLSTLHSTGAASFDIYEF